MLQPLNPIIHSELRLSIISLLMGVESADFSWLRKETGSTSGNMSVQVEKLREAGYIKVKKTYRGKFPCTICRITQKGRDAFADYVETLKGYLNVTPPEETKEKE